MSAPKKTDQDAWKEQATAHFAGADFTAGADMLREDPTEVEVPAGYVPYWALPEQRGEMSQRGYIPVDPQPKDHPMAYKGMMLYFTPVENRDNRRRAENMITQGAKEAANPHTVAAGAGSDALVHVSDSDTHRNSEGRLYKGSKARQ